MYIRSSASEDDAVLQLASVYVNPIRAPAVHLSDNGFWKRFLGLSIETHAYIEGIAMEERQAQIGKENVYDRLNAHSDSYMRILHRRRVL